MTECTQTQLRALVSWNRTDDAGGVQKVLRGQAEEPRGDRGDRGRHALSMGERAGQGARARGDGRQSERRQADLAEQSERILQIVRPLRARASREKSWLTTKKMKWPVCR